jgi:hypothetical protein
LHSVPEIDGKAITGEIRQKEYTDAKSPIPYVELEAGQYLISELFAFGPDKPAPMGGGMPLSAQDVWYHCLNTGVHWEPWERAALVKMSEGYCRARAEGKDVFCIAPVDRD